MANCIGYEALYVNGVAVGPSDSLVGGGAACAVFFVDPTSPSPAVRYVPGQVRSTLTNSSFSPPTPTRGIPLRRGKSIVVAGSGNIQNSWFVAESGSALLHCLYYDRVDVVDLGLEVDQALLDVNTEIRDRLDKVIELLQRERKEG